MDATAESTQIEKNGRYQLMVIALIATIAATVFLFTSSRFFLFFGYYVLTFLCYLMGLEFADWRMLEANTLIVSIFFVAIQTACFVLTLFGIKLTKYILIAHLSVNWIPLLLLLLITKSAFLYQGVGIIVVYSTISSIILIRSKSIKAYIASQGIKRRNRTSKGAASEAD